MFGEMLDDWEALTIPQLWNREGDSTLHRRVGLPLTCLMMMAGMGAATVGMWYTSSWVIDEENWGYVIWFMIWLSIAAHGAALALESDEIWDSLRGHAYIAGSLGLIVGPFAHLHEGEAALRVIILLGLLLTVCAVVTAALADHLVVWALVVAGVGAVLMGGHALPELRRFDWPVGAGMTPIDWAVVAGIGGLILYHLIRARYIPYTFNNSIDVAMHVFMSFINGIVWLIQLAVKIKDWALTLLGLS